MPRDDRFISRFSEHAKLIVPAAEAFRALMSGDARAEERAREINRLEDQADLIARGAVLAGRRVDRRQHGQSRARRGGIGRRQRQRVSHRIVAADRLRARHGTRARITCKLRLWRGRMLLAGQAVPGLEKDRHCMGS